MLVLLVRRLFPLFRNFAVASRMERKPLLGRELFAAIGRPKKIVAPMVDQSELAWRIISRRYGAQLCYTPMFHARLFATQEKYRQSMWSELDGEGKVDRPLIVQFCANDPEYLLQAAKLVEEKCDAVDLNLGCPQGIAKKGHYGAFLMDDWNLVYKLINTLHKNLRCPVTAKIRVYDDWEKSLDYAKHVLNAGAQFITIHGRTRDMKGQATGLANWDLLRYLKDNLPSDRVFFANGNIVYPEDVEKCFAAINCDAVMSAEGNLYNPGIFWTENSDHEKQFRRVDCMLREYFEVVKSCPGQASKNALKSHFFKILHAFLENNKDLRPLIGKASVHASFEEWEALVKIVEERVSQIYRQDVSKIDVITESISTQNNMCYKNIPYWRCQPYFRTVDGIRQTDTILQIAADKLSSARSLENQRNTSKKRLDTAIEKNDVKKAHLIKS